MKACIHPLKMSKYSDKIAGSPIWNSGNSPILPGIQLNKACDTACKPAATRAEMTEPEF